MKILLFVLNMKNSIIFQSIQHSVKSRLKSNYSAVRSTKKLCLHVIAQL